MSDEEEDPLLPAGFRTYQKVWATEERNGTEQFKAILLGTLEPNTTVVIQWEGCHKVGGSTECRSDTVTEVEYNQISHQIPETNDRDTTLGGQIVPRPTRPPPENTNTRHVMTPNEAMNTYAIIERTPQDGLYPRDPTKPYERTSFHKAANGTVHAWALYVGGRYGASPLF